MQCARPLSNRSDGRAAVASWTATSSGNGGESCCEAPRDSQAGKRRCSTNVYWLSHALVDVTSHSSAWKLSFRREGSEMLACRNEVWPIR
jgi:hypothetical protein